MTGWDIPDADSKQIPRFKREIPVDGRIVYNADGSITHIQTFKETFGSGNSTSTMHVSKAFIDLLKLGLEGSKDK